MGNTTSKSETTLIDKAVNYVAENPVKSGIFIALGVLTGGLLFAALPVAMIVGGVAAAATGGAVVATAAITAVAVPAAATVTKRIVEAQAQKEIQENNQAKNNNVRMAEQNAADARMNAEAARVMAEAAEKKKNATDKEIANLKSEAVEKDVKIQKQAEMLTHLAVKIATYESAHPTHQSSQNIVTQANNPNAATSMMKASREGQAIPRKR